MPVNGEKKRKNLLGPLSLKGIKCCRSTSSENIFKIKMASDTNCILLDAGGCLHNICNKTFTDGTFLTK